MFQQDVIMPVIEDDSDENWIGFQGTLFVKGGTLTIIEHLGS